MMKQAGHYRTIGISLTLLPFRHKRDKNELEMLLKLLTIWSKLLMIILKIKFE